MKKQTIPRFINSVVYYCLKQATNTFPVSANVRIGSINPTNKLDVVGCISLREGFYRVTSASAVTWANTNIMGHAWDGQHDFTSLAVTGNLANAAEMRLLPNRNVGIDTSTPQSKLPVSGTVKAKPVRVTQTSWPDYVSSNTYRFRPLAEVDPFISIHHHLPDIPSAKELKARSLDLGEVVEKQMKIIEELMLYPVDTDKTIRELQTELMGYRIELTLLKQKV